MDASPGFDQTVLFRFVGEIADWPAEQAEAAFRVIKGVLEGGEAGLRALDAQTAPWGDLTTAQAERVHQILRQIFGEQQH
jgi:hypothetical protein